MTFVAGFKCSGGLVICADQLEDDGIKIRYRNKITRRMIGDRGNIVWACSGTSSTIEKFTDKLSRLLGSDFDGPTAEVHIEACLKYINEQYDYHSRVEVIIGMCGQEMVTPARGEPYPHWQTSLYKAFSTDHCVSPQPDYCFAGMDTTLAEFIVRNTFTPFMDVEETIRLGVFVTAAMKQYASRVGGETNVYTCKLGDSNFTTYGPDDIAAIEAALPVDDFNWAMTNHWWSKFPAADDNFKQHLRESIATRKKMPR